MNKVRKAVLEKAINKSSELINIELSRIELLLEKIYNQLTNLSVENKLYNKLLDCYVSLVRAKREYLELKAKLNGELKTKIEVTYMP